MVMQNRRQIRYYHGGPRGLREVLPAAISGAASTADMSFNNGVCLREKAYVTTNYAAAIMFAAVHDVPTVYEVEPVNPTPDPDCSVPGLAYECDRARIIRKLPVHFKHFAKARKAILTPSPKDNPNV